MCWRYEDQYHNCFDHLSFGDVNNPDDVGNDRSLIVFLHDNYDVSVTNEWEFTERIMVLLSKMHEDGVIKPMAETPNRWQEIIDEPYG